MFVRVVLPTCMWLLFSATAWAGNLNPQALGQKLDQCINSFFTSGKTTSRDTDISLKKRCPAVLKEISHPAFNNLQPPLQEQTTLAQLQDARAILKFLHTQPTEQFSYNAESLNKVLSDTYIEKKQPEAEASWWDRFLDWLKEALKSEEAEPPEWLVKFLESFDISKDTVMIILKVSILLLVIMAILIVFNELRAANLLAAWRHRQQKKHIQTLQMQSVTGGPALTLEQISQLQGRKQSSAILYYILVHLMNKGLLPEKYNLTNHELADRTENFPAEPSGLVAGFKRFMGLSDLSLYARKEPDTEEQQQALKLAYQIKEQSESA